MKAILVTLLTGTVVVTTQAQARPVFLNQLRGAFPDAPVSTRCNTCHRTGGPQLNLFGKDFALLRQQFGPARMPEAWVQLRTMDSDHDGVDNETELNAGRNPGRPDQEPDPEQDSHPDPNQSPNSFSDMELHPEG